MKKISLISLIIIFVFFAILVMAQEDKKEKIPPGMEIMQIGNTNFIVPKGVQFHKKGDLIILETAAEYAARRLLDMEERLAKIEAKIKEFNEKIEQFNKALNEIPKNSLTSNKEEK